MATKAERWRFPQKRRVDPNIDPVQGEFFTPEGLVDGLVRESIQNSLDAGRGKGVVRVQFSLYEDSKALDPEKHSKYMTGLWEHLESLDAEFPDQDDPMSFLVIEDFGTSGLNGDPTQSVDVSEGEEKNNFYYFWRNIGRSEKSETDRGRWGLGKTVFPAASRINSFLGLTVREDGRRLLMGQSVVKVHQVGEQFFTAYGGFGEFESDDFVMPIENAHLIREFSSDFHLQRTAEAGLSVVIPFFRGDEIDIEDIIRAVIVHYFFPILSGDLIVHFTDGATTEVATASTLDALAGKYWADADSADDMKKLFDLARWAVTDPERMELKRPGEHSPYWGDHMVDAAALEDMRKRYDDGERLAFRVPVPIKPKATRTPVMSYFDMYLQRDDAAPKGQRQYLRRGITIPNKDVMRVAGARGLIVINDKLLSSVLGDAEGPAHTEWNEKSPKIKNKYVYAPAIVRFVKTSFDEAVTLLSRPPEGVEEDLLSDLFSIEMPEDEKDETSVVKKRKKGPTPPPEIKIENPTPSSFSLVRSPGGFVVRKAAASALGRTIRLTAAYDVSRGNPMKRYDPFDFEFDKDPIVIQMRGCTATVLRQNHAEFEITEEDFEIDVRGFDSHRDLRVKATSIGGAE